MSFLNQLKSQASAMQSEQSAHLLDLEDSARLTELAARTAWLYVSDLAKQLNVIQPAGPKLSLDGKTHWPAMKLVDFAADARRKRLFDKEVFDYVSLVWRIVPKDGVPAPGSVSANFPPDLNRIESRVAAGVVKHDRVNVRHPEKNTLQAIRFDYMTESRGGITMTCDHSAAKLVFRLANLQSFAVVETTYLASHVQPRLLDELAKMMVGEASIFV